MLAGDSLKKILLVILAILMFGDVATTNIILNRSGVEYNLLMEPIVSNNLIHLAIKVLAVLSIIFLANQFVKWIQKTNGHSTPKYVSTDLAIIAALIWFAGVNIFNLTSLL